MVEIFKTNVNHPEEAYNLVGLLLHHYPSIKTNFDLEDCDKILRAEGEIIPLEGIINLLNKHTFTCELID